MEVLTEWWVSAKEVLTQQVPVAWPLGIVVFVLLWNLAWSRRDRPTTEGNESMAKRKKTKQVVGDAIVDTIENLVHNHLINRKDANYFYRRLAEEWNLPSLIPGSGIHVPPYLRQQVLKDTIAKRITNGSNKPVLNVLEGKRDAIPEPKPEDTALSAFAKRFTNS